jgi:hypothetical protein
MVDNLSSGVTWLYRGKLLRYWRFVELPNAGLIEWWSSDHLQESQFFYCLGFSLLNLRRRHRWHTLWTYGALYFFLRLLWFFFLFCLIADSFKDTFEWSLDCGINLRLDNFKVDLLRLILFHPIRILLPCSQPLVGHLLLQDRTESFLKAEEFNLILFDQDSASACLLLLPLSYEVSLSLGDHFPFLLEIAELSDTFKFV